MYVKFLVIFSSNFFRTFFCLLIFSVNFCQIFSVNFCAQIFFICLFEFWRPNCSKLEPFFKLSTVLKQLFNFHQNCVERNGIVSFWKNDYQLHENWQLAAVLAGLQGRGSSREKEGNVIQQIFFCYSTLRLLFWLKNGGRHSSVEISFRSSEHKLCNKTFQTLKIHDTEFVSWVFNLSNWNKKPIFSHFLKIGKNWRKKI